MLAQHFDDHLHDLAALFDVSHFAASEQHADLDLVLVLQEFFGLANLGANVFVTGLWTQANFLRLGVSLSRVFLLVLVVFEFAVIHDSANWRTFARGDLDKIKSRIAGTLQSIISRNDSELFSVFADNANRCDSNVVVDSGAVTCVRQLVSSS